MRQCPSSYRKEDLLHLFLLSGGYWLGKIGWMGRSHQGLRERGLDAVQSRRVKECTSQGLTLALRTAFEVAVGVKGKNVSFPSFLYRSLRKILCAGLCTSGQQLVINNLV